MTCTHPEHKWHRTDKECDEAMARLENEARVRQMSVPLIAVPTEGN